MAEASVEQSGLPTVAVVLAGGVGVRVGPGLPKQLLTLAGRPMLERVVATFDAHPGVDEVLVLMAAGHVEAARELLDRDRYAKLGDVVAGGRTRSETARRALSHLGTEDGTVVFHDAARPLVSARVVSECLEAMGRYDAVAVAVPSTDTILEVHADQTVAAVPLRARMWRAQTPQAFRLPVIRRAYELAERDPGFEPTDDCSVVVRYLPDVAVGVVRGEERNLKVTTPVDVQVAEALLHRAATT